MTAELLKTAISIWFNPCRHCK